MRIKLSVVVASSGAHLRGQETVSRLRGATQISFPIFETYGAVLARTRFRIRCVQAQHPTKKGRGRVCNLRVRNDVIVRSQAKHRLTPVTCKMRLILAMSALW